MANSNILKNLENKKVLVIGDLIIDNFIFGRVRSLSNEAPVPRVDVKNKISVLGGIGNIATTIKSLNSYPEIISIVGKDETAKIAVSKLEDMGILAKNLVFDHTRPTTKKSRIIVKSHHIARLDYGSVAEPNEHVINKIKRNIESLVPEVDVIVVGDFGEGFLTKELMYFIIKQAETHNKKIIVYPHYAHKDYYMGVFMLAMSDKTASKILRTSELDIEHLDKVGEQLTEYFNAHVLINYPNKLITFFNKHGNVVKSSYNNNMDNNNGNIYVNTTALGVTALGIAADFDFKHVLKLAKIASELTYAKVGATNISMKEIETRFNENDVLDSEHNE